MAGPLEKVKKRYRKKKTKLEEAFPSYLQVNLCSMLLYHSESSGLGFTLKASEFHFLYKALVLVSILTELAAVRSWRIAELIPESSSSKVLSEDNKSLSS